MLDDLPVVATKTWQPVAAQGAPPSPRYGHSAIVCKSALFVFGGSDGSDEILNDFYELRLGEHANRGLSPETEQLDRSKPTDIVVMSLRGLVNNELMSDVTFLGTFFCVEGCMDGVKSRLALLLLFACH